MLYKCELNTQQVARWLASLEAAMFLLTAGTNPFKFKQISLNAEIIQAPSPLYSELLALFCCRVFLVPASIYTKYIGGMLFTNLFR